jgi:transcriptional regulator with XRE-family HTH domain
MNLWTKNISGEVDPEILAESALAMAQSTIQGAINDAAVSRADLARRMDCPRSYVTRILSGDHNLTVKTMSRALAACGFEIRFQRAPIVWHWTSQSVIRRQKSLPAQAGSAMFADIPASAAVPACNFLN